ncbi:MAG: hypothetical protein ACBR12_14300 [Microcoleus sp.]
MESIKSLAQQLQVTPGRITTITKALFDEEKSCFSPEEVAQVAGVVGIMKTRSERSVVAAAKAYKEGIAAEIRSNPREQVATNSIAVVGKELGNVAIAQEDLAIARMRAVKRAVAIRETENDVLAQLLDGGFCLSDLPTEVSQILEASQDRVLEAALGKLDYAGNFLPALAQSGAPMMLSAAVAE